MIFVTGGCGFIGSNFVRNWMRDKSEPLINLDKLTYAGLKENLCSVEGNSKYTFVKGDVADVDIVREIFFSFRPRAIINFAAESHVDRSIADAADFVTTNVVGTVNLLQVALEYWISLDERSKSEFRFIHISTDEVFGSLEANEPAFSEKTSYAPNSPYAASKAASDHFVRAFFNTYGMPCIITNCSNNYGPFQFPEKLIPKCITNAISGHDLPIYGDGLQIRDWLHVNDHCEAVLTVLSKGVVGQTYNIGGNNEISNIDLVHRICEILDSIHPREDGKSYVEQIKFVKDRAGHDRRYAIDSSKIFEELNWTPLESFDSGILDTVHWYLDNDHWLRVTNSGCDF